MDRREHQYLEVREPGQSTHSRLLGNWNCGSRTIWVKQIVVVVDGTVVVVCNGVGIDGARDEGSNRRESERGL